MLIDTDVLLDVALQRASHAEASTALLRHLEAGPPRAFIAWYTLSNLYYLLRGEDAGDTRAFLSDLTRILNIAPGDGEAFRRAAALQMPDFEDALQVGAALEAGCEVIITRNVKDFTNSPIPALTPEQALRRHARHRSPSDAA